MGFTPFKDTIYCWALVAWRETFVNLGRAIGFTVLAPFALVTFLLLLPFHRQIDAWNRRKAEEGRQRYFEHIRGKVQGAGRSLSRRDDSPAKPPRRPQ